MVGARAGRVGKDAGRECVRWRVHHWLRACGPEMVGTAPRAFAHPTGLAGTLTPD